MALLVVADGTKFVLETNKKCLIGRSSENDIVLRHHSVSRHHAEVSTKSGRHFVRDLGSSNGTWLGGRRIDHAELRDGDRLRLGDIELSFQAGSEQLAQTRDGATAAQPRRSFGDDRSKRFVQLLAAAVAIVAAGVMADRLMRVNQNMPLVNAGPTYKPAASSTVDTRSITGVPALIVGRELTRQLGRSRDGERSVAAIAQICNQGSLPEKSLPCRIAYLTRHAEGQDLGRGPNDASISFSEVTIFCDEGVLDRRSDLCRHAYAVVLGRKR